MQLTQQAKVTVLICALNEAGSIPHVLSRIPDWVDEILVVDGRSSDGTPQAVSSARSNARVLYQPGRGKGDALRHGLRNASHDVIVTLDADGQTDPAELGKFVQAIKQGYDFAKGTRFRRPFSQVRPLHRVIGNWLITLVFDAAYGVRFTDVCSGFNAFRRSAAMALDLDSEDGLADEPLINARVQNAGLRVIEIGHLDLPRLAGESKSPSWRQGYRAIRTIWRERFGRRKYAGHP